MTDLTTIETLFFAALEMPTAKRTTFLDEACRDNPDLRAQIDRLLAAHPRVRTFLEPSLTHAYTEPPTESFTAPPDDAINHPLKLEVDVLLAGKYKLLEKIGIGGMGAVWMAQQTEPIKRLVAVKVIKAGMDSKDILARFDAERQALALMDHPNISRVLDAGSTPDGRPFFVMELVKGMPITQFCDEHRLTPRERLELFVPVCQAIQHAHQKGVIHRDIKPRNVLVALYDGRPVPKVIDFGVAKAISQPLTEQTLNTGCGAIVGTPEYMSPEQATFNNLDIDTRSDVYGLGVLLYELLTGSPPIPRHQLEKAGLWEVLRVVREEEPQRPSTRLSTADALPSLAVNRGMEPRRLTVLLRNELDWIVMKALEKDRRRRYDSANGFAADVLRYLSGEPVHAVPPSTAYRLRKFVKKHRTLVFGFLAVLSVLLLGMVGTTWGLLRAEQAKTSQAEQQGIAEANEAARAREETARVKAESEVERQQQAEEQRRLRNRGAALTLLSQFEEALRNGNSAQAKEASEQMQKRIGEGGADDLIKVMERYRNDLETLRELDRIDDDCWIAVDGKLPSHQAIAFRWKKVFTNYGIPLDTLSPKDAADRIRDSLLKERLLTSLEIWFVVSHQPDLLDILALADDVIDNDFRNEARATSYQQAVRSRKARNEPLPQFHPVWFAIGHGGGDSTMDHQTREGLLIMALRMRPNNYALLMTLGNLDAGDKDSGLRRAGWYRAALVVQPDSVVAWNNLGNVLGNTNDLKAAIAACKEAVRLDSDHVPPFSNLALALAASGDHVGAIAAYKEAIRINPNDAHLQNNYGNSLKAEHDMKGAIAAYQEAARLDPKFATPHYNLGVVFFDIGEKSRAIDAYKEAIRLDPKRVQSHNNLGIVLAAADDVFGAMAAFREAARLDPKFAQAHNNLGIALANSGAVSSAIAEFREAIYLDPKFVSPHLNLGNALMVLNDLPGAISAYKDTIRLDPKYALAHLNLGKALKTTGELKGAIAELREAVHLDPKNAQIMNHLGLALAAGGEVSEAIATYEKAMRLDPSDALPHYNLGGVYMRQKKYREAIRYAREAIKLNPMFADAYSMLSYALQQTDDPVGARNAMMEAARIDPKRFEPLLAKLTQRPIAPPPREAKP